MEHISEFKESNYRDFYSMVDFVNSIGNTIKVRSWGAHAWTKMNDKLLRFMVHARRHKGHIYVAVNGLDLFDVFLTTTKGKIKKTFENIYIEDFIDIVDNEIENIPEYTD